MEPGEADSLQVVVAKLSLRCLRGSFGESLSSGVRGVELPRKQGVSGGAAHDPVPGRGVGAAILAGWVARQAAGGGRQTMRSSQSGTTQEISMPFGVAGSVRSSAGGDLCPYSSSIAAVWR